MTDTGYHSALAASLRGGETGRLAAFIAEDARNALSVYRNTIVRGAIDVLGDNYPAVRFLAGEGNFAALAKSYWQANPPHTGPMLLYGAGFADHLEAVSPRGMPGVLPDIARIDRAWSEAHHSVNAPVQSLGDIRALGPEEFAALCPVLHPSARLLAADRPVFTTWHASRFAARVELAGAQGEETVLVWRPALEVRFRTLAPGEADFLNAIKMGASLTEAGERSGATPETFIRLLKDGVFART